MKFQPCRMSYFTWSKLHIPTAASLLDAVMPGQDLVMLVTQGCLVTGGLVLAIWRINKEWTGRIESVSYNYGGEYFWNLGYDLLSNSTRNIYTR